MNAHYFAYPEIDWEIELSKFIGQFDVMGKNIKRHQYTTQIDHYNNHARIFDSTRRINVILIDFCYDIHSYISRRYFKQKPIKGEIGSSTMSHKINPILFENAIGNLGVADAYLSFFSTKLPISREQRDLTDSTVIRNLCVAFGHGHLAYENILDEIELLELNHLEMNDDLEKNWVVISEGYSNPSS